MQQHDEVGRGREFMLAWTQFVEWLSSGDSRRAVAKHDISRDIGLRRQRRFNITPASHIDNTTSKYWRTNLVVFRSLTLYISFVDSLDLGSFLTHTNEHVDSHIGRAR